MEIVEIIDHRFQVLYSRHHLLGSKNHFFISAIIGNVIRGYLIWPGGDIKIRYAFSKKRLRELKTSSVELAENKIHNITGYYNSDKSNYMSLKEETDNQWSLSYNPLIDTNIRIEIYDILKRLKI